MNKTKVYLSPSAQSANKYAYGNVTEQTVCNRIANEAKIALERNGFEVKKSPEGQPFRTNVAESNSWGSDVHIPIHTNAGGGEGTVIFAHKSSVNDKYIRGVYDAVATLSVGKDDGIRAHTGLYEINNTKCVCVYVECEFHDNSVLAKWIIDHVKELGEAIAKGMCDAEDKIFVSDDTETLYRVQLGAFKERANAEKLVVELQKKGYEAYVK